MELIRPGTRFDFIGKRKYTLWVSIVAISVTALSLLLHGGLRYGVDFAGGIVLQVKFAQEVKIHEVRTALESTSKDVSVQKFGEANEFLVRVEKSTEDLETISKTFQTVLQEKFKDKGPEIRRVELVGPKVGKDLKTKAIWAVGLSFLAILIYVAIRFRDFSYGLGGIVALVHDVIITYGAISIFNLEYTLSLMAVILTVIGFSINDTIVIFDRVRENIKKMRKEKLGDVFNMSINECLGRTLLTTGTVLMVVLILFFIGGPVIHDFAAAMLVGLITGAYSTVYIASPVVLVMEEFFARRRRKR